MTEEKTFTEPLQCGHCGNKAPMEIVSRYSALHDYTDERDERTWFEWRAGVIYQLGRCPACAEVTLRRYFWHDGYDVDDIKFEILYPKTRDMPRGLPDAISKAYQAATRVRAIDVNAYSVLLGRVLEFVCEDRSAQGASLADKLQDLSSKGEIPEKLVDVAKGLRQLRNVGAHASLGELTDAEAPVLDDLTRAILEYVYTAPLLAQDAEDRLKKLNKGKSAGRNTTGKKSS